MNEYSPFNSITLTFLNMSNVFHVNIGVVYAVWHILDSIFTEKCIQNLKEKVNKIELKGLYSFIF